MRRYALSALILFAFTLSGGRAGAQGIDVHGRLEGQDAGLFSRGDTLQSALGARDADDFSANLRLTWEPSWGRWSLQLHYVEGLEAGPEVGLKSAEAGLLPPPPSTWFDLTNTIVSQRQVIAQQGIDRLAVGYTSPDLVVRVGRQALTWGAGLVFHPMDLIDPFSPSETDTEWKPGADMVYVQRLFANGSDLQVVVAPRPTRFGAAPSANASTMALHYQVTLLGHSTTWLLANDDGDVVAGVGISGALGGATWNLEVVPTFERAGVDRVSGLANLSDAVTLFDRNATVFAEYFHNGFGVTAADAAYSNLPPDLRVRLARGQLFDTRRDYLAGGVTLEVTPLLTLSPTLIVDLDDTSAFALLAGTYSLGDNLTLVAGLQAPVGPARSEFGGLPLTTADQMFLAPPTQVYIQIRRYF